MIADSYSFGRVHNVGLTLDSVLGYKVMQGGTADS
jgi:hypothetical protein